MAKKRYTEEELNQPLEPPSLLRRVGNAGLSGLSIIGNVLDLPSSSVRDVLAGQNPFDQWATPTRSLNRTTGRDLLRTHGLIGKKDTYGNFFGGLAAEIALDPLMPLLGGGKAAGAFGSAAAKAGIHGLEAARIATAAAKAGRIASTGARWVGPREARHVLTGDLIREFAPEQFKMLESTVNAGNVLASRKGKQTYDLAANMQEPLGGLMKFWPTGTVIGQGGNAQKIARGMDVAGDFIRHARIPGTAIRPVGDLANLVNQKAGKAVNPEDLQTAYHAHHVKEGARYEANLLTAKWTNDLRRIGHGKTEAMEVRDWFEFPHTAPPEAQPLVREVRDYIDRIPAIAQEIGVKIDDLTPKLKHAGSDSLYFMRHLAEGITGGKNIGGRLFDPFASAELARKEFLHGSRAGTRGLAVMAKDPVLERLISEGKNPKSAERWIAKKYGLKFDAAGNEIGGNLPAQYLDNEQIAKLKEMGEEPTVANAVKLAAGMGATKPEHVIRFRDLLKSKGNLAHREADAIAKIYQGYAEGYLGMGLGPALKKLFKGDFMRGGGIRQGQRPPLSALKQQNPLGFYSKLEEVIEASPQDKFQPDQLMAYLRNKGVKEEEIADLGIEDFAKTIKAHGGGEAITKDELRELIQSNAAELVEVRRNDVPEDPQKWAERSAVRAAEVNANLAMTERAHGLGIGIDDMDPGELADAVQASGDQELINLHRAWIEADERVFTFENDLHHSREGGTKYEDYQLPGGKNYQEVVLHMPGKKQVATVSPEKRARYRELSLIAQRAGGWPERMPPGTLEELRALGDEIAKVDEPIEAGRAAGNFMSSHWQEPNVLAHIRHSDRTGPNGEKILHIEEIQSDWHQEGRKRGYKPTESQLDAMVKRSREIQFKTAATPEEAAALKKEGEELGRYLSQDTRDRMPPDAPFKKSWHTLAMKRMIRYAAENGYDKIAWTPGIEQVKRYEDETRRVADRLFWSRMGYAQRKTVGIQKGGNDLANLVLDNRGIIEEAHGIPEAVGKPLEDVIGKSMAQKVLAENMGDLAGKDFTVGGQGMEGFYDNILVNDTNKLIKKHGGKVGSLDVDRYPGAYETPEMTEKWLGSSVKSTLHSFDIPQSLKDEVLNKGQALYQKDGGTLKGAVDFAQDGKATLYAFRNTDVSTHLHELSHIMRRHLTDDDQRIADQFVGATGQWTRDQEEKFARGFERYIREGVVSSAALGKLFERLKKWMISIYQSISGSQIDVQLSPEIKELYGRLVGGPPRGGLVQANKLKPHNTYEAVAGWLKGMPSGTRKVGIFNNHPVNDFAASVTGTLDKLSASRVALDRLADAAVPIGPGTVPVNVLVKQLGLEPGDGVSGGALSYLARKGMTDFDQFGVPEDTAKFLTQMTAPTTGGDKELHAFLKVYDDLANFTKFVFTSMKPNFNPRNLASGQVANAMQPEQLTAKAITDANTMLRGGVIQGASQNPFIMEEAAKRGIQNLDDERATQILSEMAYAREVTGSYGVSLLPQHGHLATGGQLQDIVHGLPGGEPFRFGNMLQKAMGGFGNKGTTNNPFKASVRGVAGAEKTTFGLGAAGEDLSYWTEGLNRLAPFWALLQNGVHPDEAVERVLKAQVAYQGRFYTKFEQQWLKRLFLFYSFSKGQLPFTLQQLVENPGGRLAQTLRGINQFKDEDELVPAHVAETASIPLGSQPDGTKRYITGLGMGFEDPAQFAQPSLQNAMLELASRTNPLLKGPLEHMTGQSFFQRGPSGGGRSLEDLNPAFGQTLANIGQITGLRNKKSPVTWPGSRGLEHVLSNSPFSTLLTTARTVTDPRKGPLTKAVNLTTGLRLTDVSPQAQDRELLNRASIIEKQLLGARDYKNTFIPQDRQAEFTPKEQEMAAELKALRRLLEERKKQRK